MRVMSGFGLSVLALFLTIPALAEEPKTVPALANYFPPSEEQGGWRTLLPKSGDPNAEQKAKIRQSTGVDWEKLQVAWELNASVGGATGLLVIRRGTVVGEWYKDCDAQKTFNIYSSSKAYTSVAF